jgi:pentatricopeptide repeat protein
MSKLKGFISYAHKDEDYFQPIKDGLKAHGKHSKVIDSTFWTDEQIPVGSKWHEAIQEQVKGCDFAVFLVSANFLASEYIEVHELNRFLARQKSEGFLFFPILISPCFFSKVDNLASYQFFKPNGNKYGHPELGTDFTFSHLIQWNVKSNKPFPNPFRDQYFLDLIESIEKALEEYQFLNSKKEGIKDFEYYKSIPIKEIKSVDILETRSYTDQGFHPYYLDRRYIDDELIYNYQNRRHTIIAGKPLAGKSRAFLNLCHLNLSDKEVDVLFVKRKDFKEHEIDFPITTSEMILFFDDFEQYVDLENLNLFLRKAFLHPQIRVIATCREDQLSEVENKLTKEFENFHIIKILPLSKLEENEFKANIPNIAHKKSDGTIGGFSFPLHEMHKRFKSLLSGSLDKEIMRTCKVLRIWGKVTPEKEYLINDIKEYFQKRRINYFQNDKPIPPFEWDRAIQSLESKKLILINGNALQVEELYLEEFVEEDEGKIKQEILDFFPEIITFNKLLNKAPDYEEAKQVFQQMQDLGIRPNEVTFNSLLTKAPDYKEAKQVLQQMQELGIRPNEVTFSSLLTKAPDYEEAKQVFQQMQDLGIRPNEFTFNSLLTKAPDYEEAKQVFQQMQDLGIRPDEFTFSSLLTKAPDYEEAKQVFQQMQDLGIRPDEFTFSSLLTKAPDYEEAKQVFQQMQDLGIRPNEFTFSSLLTKAPDYEEAKQVFQQMEELGIRPDEFTFSSLLTKAPDYEEAKQVLQQMQELGIRPDEFTFSSLLTKAPDYEEAKQVFQQMEELGIRPDEFTFSSLLTKAPDYEEAKQVFQQMQELGIRPNEVTFNSLLTKAPDYEEAKQVLQQMQELGIRPNEVTFNSLLTKAPDYYQEIELLNKLLEMGFQIDVFHFNLLINDAPNYEQANELIKEIQKKGIHLNTDMLNSLLMKALDFQQAMMVCNQMQNNNIRPDVNTINFLLSRAINVEEEKVVLIEMDQLEIEPNEGTINEILNKTRNDQELKEAIKRIKNLKIQSLNNLITRLELES